MVLCFHLDFSDAQHQAGEVLEAMLASCDQPSPAARPRLSGAGLDLGRAVMAGTHAARIRQGPLFRPVSLADGPCPAGSAPTGCAPAF